MNGFEVIFGVRKHIHSQFRDRLFEAHGSEHVVQWLIFTGGEQDLLTRRNG